MGMKSPTMSLFHESLNEALNDCIRACGGGKQVAVRLWPEKAPDAAHRLLLDCLNADRPQHLTPEQLVLVLRLAREKGCHIGATYLMHELGYDDPKPIEPRDEAADLQRAFMQSVEQQRQILARMERLQGLPVGLRAAA
jgi:hypothetical protein